MCRFIESIRFEKEDYQLLDYHQSRVDRTFKTFFPGKSVIKLAAILPKLTFEERHKVRVVYSEDQVDVEYARYHPRKVSSLRVVQTDAVAYEFKKEDRRELDKLYKQRVDCDDIIIVKNGKVTDSYYANLIFWDGSRWITPYSKLLNGVKRQFLLDQGQIHERTITLDDIWDFESVSLINAMLDPGEVIIPTIHVKKALVS